MSGAREAGPILLLGASGQLGTALAGPLARLGTLDRRGRADADLTRPDEIRRLIRRVAPSAIVNAAAYTAVDDAERDAERCALVNAEAPGAMAEEAARLGVPLVHFSTNYVFDGTQSAPYAEGDTVRPISVYGTTKAEGERRVIAAGGRTLILRTAGVYGWEGRNFVRRMLELAHERDELRVVDDQFVSPTPTWVLADATATALAHLLSGRQSGDPIVHLTTRGGTSWYEFARQVLALDPARSTQRATAVRPVTSAEYPTAAARPRNGVLAVDRFESRFGLTLPRWDEALRRTMTSERSCLGAT